MVDLNEKFKDNQLPDTIILRKVGKMIAFEKDYINEHTFLGTFDFSFSKHLLKAIDKKLEEIENKI